MPNAGSFNLKATDGDGNDKKEIKHTRVEHSDAPTHENVRVIRNKLLEEQLGYLNNEEVKCWVDSPKKRWPNET